MRNAYRKEILLSEIAGQVNYKHVKDVRPLSPFDYGLCDYDRNIMIDDTGVIIYGFHKTARLIDYCEKNKIDDMLIDIIVVTHKKTINIIDAKDNWLRTKLIGLVINRVQREEENKNERQKLYT